jgi:hypothetical protein
VATSSVPNAVSGSSAEFGASAFIKAETAVNWTKVGQFTMTQVPTGTGNEVNAGAWLVAVAEADAIRLQLDWLQVSHYRA